MIDALIAGRLRGAVAVRQSTNGNTFATWRIAAAGKDGESLLCSCITFSQKAIAAMQALSEGDSVALSGDGVLTVTDTKTGQPLAVSVPGMVCELALAFVPPPSFAEELD
jgi:hypothetical protein